MPRGPRIGTDPRLRRVEPRISRPGAAAVVVPPATRFYLPNANNTRPVSPTPDALWEVATFGAAPLTMGAKLQRAKTNTSHAGPAVVKSDAANPCDVLNAQHVSDPLTAATTITGTVSAVIRCSESVSTADSFFQLVVRVVSNAGTTVRGVLYAGQSATAPTTGTGSSTGEFTTTSSTRFISAAAVTPVAAQVGDRIVVETGYRSCTAATGHTGFLRYGDLAASADHDLVGGVTTDLVPWVELSASLTF